MVGGTGEGVGFAARKGIFLEHKQEIDAGRAEIRFVCLTGELI